MRHGGLGQVEVGADVELEGVLPLLVGDLLEALARHLIGGVADQHVDLAELLDRLADHGPAVGGVVQVTRHQHRLAGVLLLLGQVGDEHVGALAGEGDRHGTADAGVPARDDRGLALELAGASVALLAAVGDGLHLRLDAGDLLLLFGKAHDVFLPRRRCFRMVHALPPGPAGTAAR